MKGEVIRELRIKKGYTQVALAKKVGMHRTYLNDIEHNRTVPSVKKLVQIADALNVSVKKFF